MLDIDLFREHKGNDPEDIRESQRRRFKNVEIVDEIISLDKEFRQRQFELQKLREEFNQTNWVFGRFKTVDRDTSELTKHILEIKKLMADKEPEVQKAKAALYSKLETVGNLVDDSVPVSNDAANNAVVRLWGEKRMEPKLKTHFELFKLLGIAHLKRGVNVAEGRGYYLKGAGILLNQALVDFGISFLKKRSCKKLPDLFAVRKDVMAKCAQPAQLDKELYKVPDEEDDEYVIATAEQYVCAKHLHDLIHPSKLPIRYVGHSTYFHKKAGSHGRHTLDAIKVNQFEKVEQFWLTLPNCIEGCGINNPLNDESWQAHEELIEDSEDFYKALNIPYKVVSVVSGALNDASAKTYKLEAWFPASETFKEVGSCSNWTDYRSRRLNIRYGRKRSEKEKYVHLLNSILTTAWTICCVLENYQTEDGVEVPEVLRPLMGEISFLPFKVKPTLNANRKKSKA